MSLDKWELLVNKCKIKVLGNAVPGAHSVCHGCSSGHLSLSLLTLLDAVQGGEERLEMSENFGDKCLWGPGQHGTVSSAELRHFLKPCPASGKPEGWCLNPSLFIGVTTTLTHCWLKKNKKWAHLRAFYICRIVTVGRKKNQKKNIIGAHQTQTPKEYLSKPKSS